MGEDMLSVLRATRAVPDPDELEPALLARAADGDRDAARALVARYQQRGFGLVSRTLPRAIEAALADLSPELRAAFLLREFHGLEYSEIARSLGIDLGTVKSRLSRARVALRERLAEVRP